MSAVKMGLTIGSRRMYGYRKKYHAEAGGLGQAARPQGRKTIIRRDTLERFMTVNQGRNLLKPDDVRRVE